MRKLITIFLLVICCSFSGGGNFIKTKINKYITISIPESFTMMSKKDRVRRVLSYRDPIAMYTNYERDIDFGINISTAQWEEGDMHILKDFYKVNIKHLYHSVEFISEDIKEIHGKEFVTFEFLSTIKGNNESVSNRNAIKKYTNIIYTVHDGEILLFNFTCPAYKMQKWQPISRHIMNSVIIKG